MLIGTTSALTEKGETMRLIDADALKDELNNWAVDLTKSKFPHYIKDDADCIIDTAPTIDAVPVIRCRDCRWWDKEREQCGITPSASPYGHCHDGETLEHSMIKDAGR